MIGYSEGYLASSNLEDESIYADSFNKGKNYSLEYGKILGKIEYIKLNI